MIFSKDYLLLERLAVNAKVATFLGSIPCSILRHSEIWGAADEAVLNNEHKKKEKIFKNLFGTFCVQYIILL
jgi:hypothetical protein